MATTQYTVIPERVALAKLTYGYTASDLSSIKSSGISSWVASQLDPNLGEGDSCLKKLVGFKSLGMSAKQVSTYDPFVKNNYSAGLELSMTTLIYRLFSQRQLYEMLVEHFNDYLHVPTYTAWQSRMSYDRDVIRANVLGTYPNMLVASSLHPAMLEYLNGNDNTKDAPNENYGRELQELHTITSHAGYLESDVVNAARVFSGISWDYDAGQLVIDPDSHWTGAVSVFGWKNANDGTTPDSIRAVTESLVRYLALRPETARAFSTRMARRFLADDPPSSVLDVMSAKYLSTGGDIPSVVKVMVAAPEFLASAGQKVKRPMEYVGSVVRSLKLELATAIQPGDAKRPDDYFHDSVISSLVWHLATQGQEPMNWPFPNGYPDKANPWTTLNSQIRRWNLGAALAHGWNEQDFRIPLYDQLLNGVSAEPAAVVDALAQLLLGAPLSVDDRNDILAVVSPAYDGSLTQSKLGQLAQTATSLILSLPTWNFR